MVCGIARVAKVFDILASVWKQNFGDLRWLKITETRADLYHIRKFTTTPKIPIFGKQNQHSNNYKFCQNNQRQPNSLSRTWTHQTLREDSSSDQERSAAIDLRYSLVTIFPIIVICIATIPIMSKMRSNIKTLN